MAVVANREDLIATLTLHAPEIRACGVHRLGVFGSFARGEQRPESDVDVLVEFEVAAKTFDNFMTMTRSNAQ